jgi:hypothetical protein
VIALSDVIDFLLALMGDEARRTEFEQDPAGSLQAAGLEGLSGQDVRDAELQMRDSGLLRESDSGGGGGGSRPPSDDPVREIQHTTTTYQVTEIAPQIIQIDDRDTIFNDSFDSDDDITIIDDSFNDSSSVENDVVAVQDNDTIINDNDTISDDDTAVVVEGGVPTTGAPVPGAPEDDPEDLRLGIGPDDVVGPGGPPPEPAEEPAEDAADVTAAAPEPEQPDEEPLVEAAVEAEPEPADAAIA